MPASWIVKSDTIEIRLAHPINRAGMASEDRVRAYDLVNDSRFQEADKTKVALVLKNLVQEDLTFRQLVRDLPDDDPDKTTDPGREGFRWEGRGAKRDLVSRSTIVVSCVWDGESYAFHFREAQ